jgi:hypothetical protein
MSPLRELLNSIVGVMPEATSRLPILDILKLGHYFMIALEAQMAAAVEIMGLCIMGLVWILMEQMTWF